MKTVPHVFFYSFIFLIFTVRISLQVGLIITDCVGHLWSAHVPLILYRADMCNSVKDYGGNVLPMV